MTVPPIHRGAGALRSSAIFTGRSLRHSQAHGQYSVCTQLRLVLCPIQANHNTVNICLVKRRLADKRATNSSFDIVNRLEHTLAAVFLSAIAKL